MDAGRDILLDGIRHVPESKTLIEVITIILLVQLYHCFWYLNNPVVQYISVNMIYFHKTFE